jgi:hypothetical protein
MLIALLLPAVQAAREAARRMSCTNNQKQIVLAMHCHHDAHSTFPQGLDRDQGTTWAIRVMPFMELQTIYDAYDQDVNYQVGTNATLLTNLRISAYSCPSDGKLKSALVVNGSRDKYENHNYLVCAGNTGIWNGNRSDNMFGFVYRVGGTDANDPTSFYGGSFYGGPRLCGRIDSFGLETAEDGTSNTMLLAESIQGKPNYAVAQPAWGGNDLRGLIWWGFTCFYTAYLPPNSTAPDNGHASFEARTGLNTNKYGTVSSALRGYMEPPNYNNPVEDARWAVLAKAARSYHTGGVNAANGDGSVAFRNDSITIDVWRALSTTKGGESK